MAAVMPMTLHMAGARHTEENTSVPPERRTRFSLLAAA